MPAAGGQWVGVPRERASFAECERGRRGRRVRRLVSPPPHSPCARSKSPPLPTHCTLNVDSAALRGPGVRKGAAHAGGGWGWMAGPRAHGRAGGGGTGALPPRGAPRCWCSPSFCVRTCRAQWHYRLGWPRTQPAVGQSFPAERLGISLTRRLPTPPDRPSHHARPGPPSFFKHPSSPEQILDLQIASSAQTMAKIGGGPGDS